jgi:4-carboxymuconolactone decarboxylase
MKHSKFSAFIAASVSIVAFALAAQTNAWAEDRMPPTPLEKMTDVQKQYAAAMINGPRKALIGPFIALIRSPELFDRTQQLGNYLRFQNVLGTEVTDFTILTVGRLWNQQTIWYFHEPLALKAGVNPETLKELATGRRPARMTPDQQIAYDFSIELHQNKRVSDAVYKLAVDRSGERGVVDLIALNGYYVYVAMILNGVQTPLPADNKSTILSGINNSNG